jgi:hypothetical protein
MKVIAIIQPSFLPWLGYFEQMAYADVFVYFDDVQYTRKDWRNRNRLLSPQGAKYVSVPVVHTDRMDTRILSARVDHSRDWRREICEQIRNWYRRAPYLDVYLPKLSALLQVECPRLVDLIYPINRWLQQELAVDVPVHLSSDVPGKAEDRNQKILDICRHFEADVLYDGKAAENFIDQQFFGENGVRVVFQQYQPQPYPQQGGGDFVSHLSSLDTLLNCGPQAAQILRASPPPALSPLT